MSSWKIMVKDVISQHSLHYDFEHSSHWYYRLFEIKKYEFGLASSGITSISHFMTICSAEQIVMKKE
jgi:hypothetical protein